MKITKVQARDEHLTVVDTASLSHSIIYGPTGQWVTYCPATFNTIADLISICVWLIPGTQVEG
jgi:hypothetical protein